MSDPSLTINEIFYSIQGESTRAGLPCVFVRLTGCNLRCNFCDTEYAFHEGGRMKLSAIMAEVTKHNCNLVEITGGEPLLQKPVHRLMANLCDAGHTVLIETSGAMDISVCDERVIRIMDIKTPGSGEAQSNRWANIDHLTTRDEVKFVICDRADYDWMREVIAKHDLATKVSAILVGAVGEMAPGIEVAGCDELPLRELAEWVLADNLPVRMQTQLHKLIWDPQARGV